jgi:lambda family phage portal protein
MNRVPKIEANWLDRLITYLDPVMGAQRHAARTTLAMVGGYTGGKKNRHATSEWQTSAGNADADILPDLETIRERSRDLIRNNPLACGAMKTKVTNVVGTGLKLRSRIDAEFLGLTPEAADDWERNTEREFRLWAESQDCDAERALNFYGLQRLALMSTLENGDIFVNLPYIKRLGNPYELKVQMIEADRVCNPDFKIDTDTLAGGVEKDENGAPIVYHVLKQHPGSLFRTNFQWISLPAFGSQTGRRNVLHLFHKLRPGQSRGVPDLAPVIEAFKQMGNYTEAEVMAAVVSAMFTVFIKSENGNGLSVASNSGPSAPPKGFKMGPGAMLDLMPGEDVVFANPGRPNAQFDPFVKAILQQVGVSLELPFEVLTKHFTASYSAARASLIEAWKFFSTQRAWLSEYFCQPVYEAWLTEAVATGRIKAPGFLKGDLAIQKAYCRAEWIGPAPGQIDPLKEVKAAEARVSLGISNLEKETAMMMSDDWEVVHRQRVKEVEMRKEAGLEPLQPVDQEFMDEQEDQGQNAKEQ